MMSRGSVIPLFVEQVPVGRAADRHRPGDDPVPDVARRVGPAGRARLRRTPGPGTSSSARPRPARSATWPARWPRRWACEPDVKVIGTRHGEKLYETLATREELARADDQGDYFRVAVDARDLNYERVLRRGRPCGVRDRRLPLPQHHAARASTRWWRAAAWPPAFRALAGTGDVTPFWVVALVVALVRDRPGDSGPAPARRLGRAECTGPRTPAACLAAAGSRVLAGGRRRRPGRTGRADHGGRGSCWSRSPWPSWAWRTTCAGARHPPAACPPGDRRRRDGVRPRPTCVDAGAPDRRWPLLGGGLAASAYLNTFNFMDGINGISSLNGDGGRASGSPGSASDLRVRPLLVLGLAVAGAVARVPAVERAASAGLPRRRRQLRARRAGRGHWP